MSAAGNDGEQVTLDRWLGELREEQPYYPGQPAKERRKHLSGKLAVMLEDMHQAQVNGPRHE